MGGTGRERKEQNGPGPGEMLGVPSGTPAPAALGARAGAEPTSPVFHPKFRHWELPETFLGPAPCEGWVRALRVPKHAEVFSPFLSDVRVRAA